MTGSGRRRSRRSRRRSHPLVVGVLALLAADGTLVPYPELLIEAVEVVLVTAVVAQVWGPLPPPKILLADDAHVRLLLPVLFRLLFPSPFRLLFPSPFPFRRLLPSMLLNRLLVFPHLVCL